MENFENMKNIGKKVNWLVVGVIGLVVFGIITVVITLNTARPAAESSIEVAREDEEEFEEIREEWFTEPVTVSEEVGEDYSLDGFYSDYLSFEEIEMAKRTIGDYFRFAFPEFKEVRVEKIVRDGNELAKKNIDEEEEDEDEFFFWEEEEAEEEEENEEEEAEINKIVESTRVYLVSETGRKFYADINAGKFGLAEVLIYTEKGQEVFKYAGENEFDMYDYSGDEIVQEAFLEI